MKVKAKPLKAWCVLTCPNLLIFPRLIAMTRGELVAAYPTAEKEGRIVRVIITPIVKRKKSKKGGK